MAPADVRRVVDVWADQTPELGERYRWVQVFENRGAEMGASNPHPHGQIWAGTGAARGRPRARTRPSARTWRRRGGACCWTWRDAGGGRAAGRGARPTDWLAIVPFWAVWPFETLLMPAPPGAPAAGAGRRRARRSGGDPAARDGPLRRPVRASVPVLLRLAPGAVRGRVDADHWQLHAHFYPPLLEAEKRKFMVGYELLSEAQRDITAEDAAERLRAVSVEPWAQDGHPDRTSNARRTCARWRTTPGSCSSWVAASWARVRCWMRHRAGSRGARRAGRHRGRDLVAVVAAHPRRPALPGALRVPPGARGAPGALAAAAPRAAPRHARAVPVPDLRAAARPSRVLRRGSDALRPPGRRARWRPVAPPGRGRGREARPVDPARGPAWRHRLPRRRRGRRAPRARGRAHGAGPGRHGGHPGAGHRAAHGRSRSRGGRDGGGPRVRASRWRSARTPCWTRRASGPAGADAPLGGSSVPLVPSRGSHIVVPRDAHPGRDRGHAARARARCCS